MKFQRAVYIYDTKKFIFREEEMNDSVDPHHVRVLPMWVGICGSDLHALEQTSRKEISLGHEWVGQVQETGSQVSTLKPGDFVTSAVQIKCGQCPKCLAGSEDCENQYSLATDHGMLATLSDFPETALLKMNNDVSAETTLIEILAVAENVYTNIRTELESEKKILIIGAGSLGLSVGLVLKHYGHCTDLIEVIPQRISRGQALGLNCINATRLLMDPQSKASYDIIIDASGDHLASKGGWSYLEHFGKKQFLGIILAKYSHVDFRPTVFFLKNATLKWVQGCTNDSLKAAMKNFTDKIAHIGPHMVSHQFELTQVNEAFAMAKDREKSGRVVIKIQDKK
ncbi:MAG: alcohol dehydrogenase catalytic domain-containing protein [Bdellovibrionota bacterium]